MLKPTVTDLFRCDLTEWKFHSLSRIKNDIAKFNPLNKISDLNSLSAEQLYHIFNTAAGVEIEVEKAAPINYSGWITDRDNSLRGDDSFEFKTVFPARTLDICHLLYTFESAVKNYRRKGIKEFQFSERTSVHVHLDFRSWPIEKIRNLVAVYLIMERALFRFAGESRQHNIFCVPLYQTLQHYDTRFRDILSRRTSKYSALNLRALSEFGTVEFRHMAGTEDSQRICTWLILLNLLKFAVYNMTTEDLTRELSKLKTVSNYREFMRSIFGDFQHFLFYKPVELDRSVTDAKLILSLEI